MAEKVFKGKEVPNLPESQRVDLRVKEPTPPAA